MEELNSIPRRRERIDEFYTIGAKLGKGSFSVVFEGTERSTGIKYAVKVIKRSLIKQKLLDREIEIMTSLRHPNILFCKEVYEDDESIFLILELIKGGELYDKIVDQGEYSEEESRRIVRQIVDAVEYLHQNGIAHRDLKPENILCEILPGSTEELQLIHIKVADFGLSKMFSREDLFTKCGSPIYVAPEVISSKPYDQSVDLWSIGIITYVLLTGCFPFYEEKKNFKILYEKISNVRYEFPSDPQLSTEARDFVSRLLVREGKDRMTPQQCKEHPWLQNRHQKDRT
ncbi:hypothetical protein PROFUN_15334 [Planoprotostelium fungivorum]|uniref:non-specific serine/threonine protein kinase n=1 Tax=Planoprotostelium fungivorum TaxID=1890364 RepID=A0A2P6MWV9_9EUKA|nr:hypothetical protein PROFUN_15334 [Planoprotostelium fungivorum]